MKCSEYLSEKLSSTSIASPASNEPHGAFLCNFISLVGQDMARGPFLSGNFATLE